jgi:hypothetical protein
MGSDRGATATLEPREHEGHATHQPSTGTTRMTTEEPGDQVSSEVRASQLAAAHYPRSEGLIRLPGGGQSSRANLSCSDASHLCRLLALRLIVLPNGKEKP